MKEIRIPTSLTRHQPKNPLDEEGIKSMAAKLWHEKGTLMVDPDTVYDDMDRALLIAVGNRLCGRRKSNAS